MPKVCLLLLLLTAVPLHSTTVITGSEFDRYLDAQQVDLQIALQKCFSQDSGYLVCGPIDPTVRGKQDVVDFFRAIRVICPDLASVVKASGYFLRSTSPKLISRDSWISSPRKGSLAGIRAVLVWVRWENQQVPILFQTMHQTRLSILTYNNRLFAMEKGERKLTSQYIRAVSDYLHRCDIGDKSARAPEAISFGLPESMNIVPSNHKIPGGQLTSPDALATMASIVTDFAKGVTGIVPGDSLAKELATGAPNNAYRYLSNETELRLLSEIEHNSVERVSVFDLDSVSVRWLAAGSYCFAIGLSGRLKIGHASPSDSSANERLFTLESHLYPGEAVFCAGMIVVGEGIPSPVLEISLRSPRLFDVRDPGIAGAHAQFDRDPIWMVGHLLRRLTSLGIPWRGAVIRKY